jgi:uncharacterized protein (TIGR00661 family)
VALPESAQNNNVLRKPNVVIALLDWGLGHTTRSIPIIRHLIEIKCNILVACNSSQTLILAREFPGLQFIQLEGYDLHYGKNAWQTILSIIMQSPKILTKIKHENKWLDRLLTTYKADLIISDNRFGFYNSNVKSIFITHQLAIRSGINKTTDRLIRLFNYKYINRFDECWVPDYEGATNLAGSLSHPPVKPNTPVHYLGALSRFERSTASASSDTILIVLSGPEPQRTILEEKILRNIASLKSPVTLVRGLPEHVSSLEVPGNITVHNHLPSAELNKLMIEARWVVSRAGYTSIMDYMKTGVRSILIATPGQAEQEYIAAYLHEQKLALSINQDEFDLPDAIEKAERFGYKQLNWDMEQYKKVIEASVGSIAVGKDNSSSVDKEEF